MSTYLSNTFITNYGQQGLQVVAANSVATPAQLDKIFALWKPHLTGAPADFAFALAMACREQGSSRFGELAGSADASEYTFDAAARAVKTVCTLRQFAMAYAPAVWNFSIQKDSPPANWLRAGYTFDTRFAAFDFFNGVTHPAAITPPDGLIREPRVDEIRANKLNGASAIMAHRRDDQLTTREQAGYQSQVSASPTRPAIGWT